MIRSNQTPQGQDKLEETAAVEDHIAQALLTAVKEVARKHSSGQSQH